MRDSCRTFRSAWEHDEVAVSAHLDECAACQQWVATRERLGSALGALTRLTAPAALEQAVARELGGDRAARLGRALQSLVRRGAPPVLDERVSAWIGRVADAEVSEQRHEQQAGALRALDVQRAPDVLERLLREELEHPEQQQVERFTGSLPRLPAPAALAERLSTSVRRRALVRLLAGPLAALTAASLIVWIALRTGVDERRPYRFQVVHATTLEPLDPTARALAESLGGGVPR
ncbi:MAG TPA: hypothetical protein VF530_14680 [Planctomycetota bacterium]